ncbi:DUF938 domain-containing protein [uncultured Erythrobacter sp.]|uniref:DUF938 domain-containing protein n=1 Tax=uncultured Erythrobacter sp. TaxID=263913 RepID=UPI00262CCCB3|nr:DUF938 domain-containing protein [uncultured Erythrobacter sp.]
MKKHSPATLRNREAILSVLRHELPEWGTVLEVASGSGEHAVYFAEHMPALAWQPSDPDLEALASIKAYRADYEGVNLREPVALDAREGEWPIGRADAILCINMVHISTWRSTIGLFYAASHVLNGSDAPLILYGPFIEQGVKTAQSNVDFDAGLRARNPEWGIREVETLEKHATFRGFSRTARYEMPANNLMLVYRQTGEAEPVDDIFAHFKE